MSLKEVFESFKKSKILLKRVHDDTVKCFDEIVRKLSDPQGEELADELRTTYVHGRRPPVNMASATAMAREAVKIAGLNLEKNLAEELYTLEERDQVSSLLSQDPALIFVGQTNCGKSSIINELMGVRALPTSDQPSTARIVRATYAQKPYCHLVSRQGKKLEEIDLKGKNRIPRKIVELNQADRQDPTKVNSIILTGLDNEFLKAGVDIIDSPGRNENKALDDLVKDQLENPLAFLIYVVDGRNLFTVQDREVLTEITTEHQVMDIFFVVSKIEPEDREISDPSGDEAEHMQGAASPSVQRDKKRRVYEKLLNEGFLSTGRSTSMDEHQRFHGLSAWKIHEFYNIKKNNPSWNDPDESFTEYVQAFNRFQQSVRAFAEECLRSRVKQVCDILIRVLSRCLEFFIQKANILRKGKKTIMTTLHEVINEETELHNEIMQNWGARPNNQLELPLSKAIERLKEEIPKQAESFEYDTSQFRIPEDGYLSTEAAVGHVKGQLHIWVINKLQKRIKDELLEFFRIRDRSVNKLNARLKQIEEETSRDCSGGVSTAVRALTRCLLSSYEVQISLSANSAGLKRFFKNIGNWVVWFFKAPLKTLKGKVPVNDPEWKREFACEIIEKANSSAITSEVIRNLKTHFTSCHGVFIAEANKIQVLFESGATIKGVQIQKIHDFSPKLALLEMKAYSVRDRFLFRFPQKGNLIGQGGQGCVYLCNNIQTSDGKPCVVKEVEITNDASLERLALEVHNTRNLCHRNILPMVCSIIAFGGPPQPNTTALIVSERMKYDLLEGLPRFSSLRKRLAIALDVANALKYLHALDMMHRDVKPQNVLLDSSDVGVLTDFGLCKPEGLAMNSWVGTLPFMAPEMRKQKYTRSVDVYAFGVMLWMICEGKGNYPKNICVHPFPLVMLCQNAIEKRTPERLPQFPESCWRLMEKCWDRDQDKRPSFDIVVQDLTKILGDRSIK